MPFVGSDAHPARKRRWEDEENDGVYRLYGEEKPTDYYVLKHAQDLPARKVISLAKRTKFTDDDSIFHTELTPNHRRRLSQQKPQQEHHSLWNRPPVKVTGASLLPCHICHRRPTKKSDLDSFAQCEGCGEQTCFVCIRECQGGNADERASVYSEQEVLSRSFHMDDADSLPPEGHDAEHDRHNNDNDNTARLNQPEHHTRHAHHNHNHNRSPEIKGRKGWNAGGHRNMVCSRCCVERGVEGEVTCLGCLSGIEGA